jgi:hypothetical protein
MSLAKPRRPLLLFLIALAIGALAAVMSTQHRMRLAIGVWEPTDTIPKLELEAPIDAAPWRYSMHGRPATGSTFDSARAIITAFDLKPTAIAEAPHAMLDDPDSSRNALAEGKQLHCYNVDLGVTAILGAKGIYARMWDIDGHDGFGGNGHNLLEVWDDARQQWFAFDPYYRCYFTKDSDSAPLSFTDVRSLAILSPGRLHVAHFIPDKPTRAGADIVAEFHELTPLASLHTNNDFRWRYDHRYGLLQPLAFVLDRLPLRAARAIRTLLIGGSDRRLVLIDAYTPPHAFRAVTLVFRLLLVAAILLLALDVTLGVRGRRRLRRRLAQQDLPSVSVS